LREIFRVTEVCLVAYSALTLLVGQQEGHLAHKNMGGWWRWALVSPDGVAPSWMVSVSASVNSLLALAHPVGSGKRAVRPVSVNVVGRQEGHPACSCGCGGGEVCLEARCLANSFSAMKTEKLIMYLYL